MSKRYSQGSQSLMSTQRSMASQGTPRSESATISNKELKESARSVVRYLLMNDFDKVPIKHSDVLKNVPRNVSRASVPVMQEAAKMLREIYGIRLMDDGNKSNKHYILVNDLEHQDHISFSFNCQSEQVLLAIILSLIFMQTNGRWKDAGLEQEKVFSCLKVLNIDPTENHVYFGDVKKVLETFKSQRYLDLLRIENTDPPKYEYRWGVRACKELPPRAALEFASEMYGRDRIESWTAQYKAVCEHES